MRLIWQQRRPHYAWIILACAMVLLAVGQGVRLSFGVLVDPLVEEYGWSRGSVSLAYTFQFLTGIPVALIVGRLAERISARRIVMVGAAIFTLGMLLTATIAHLWQFQLYFGIIIGGLGSAPFSILLPVLLSRWFHRKLGVAIGLMWVSMSLGPAISSPLIRGSIETIGWSQTFIILGLVGGTLMLTAASFLRDNPQGKKLAPYGGLPSEQRTGDTEAMGSPPASLSIHQVTRTKSFWLLITVHALGCIGHSVLLAHVVSMATFAGIQSMAAAGVLSILLVSSIISRFGMSLVAERKGAKFTLATAVLLQTVPTLLLLGAEDLWSFYSFAFLFGLGFGGEMVGFPIFNRQYYGLNAPLNAIYSYQIAGAMLGMAIGGWVGGALFDWTGVYTWSILVAVGAGSLGVVAALVLPRYHR